MAAKIRLKRVGTKNRPYYRVVVIDESKARDGREIEILGSYSPVEKKDRYKFDAEKVLAWIKKGAEPSERIRILLGEAGILPKVSFEGRTKRKPRSEEKKEAAPEAPKEGAKKEEKAKEEAKEEKPKEEKPKEEKKEEAKKEEKPKEEVKAEAKEEKPKEEKKEEKPKEEAKKEEKLKEEKKEEPKAKKKEEKKEEPKEEAKPEAKAEEKKEETPKQ